jgi:AcrB/AcrD/AcrF family/Enoyl-(Acyl carrier protein) reductase
MNPSGWFIERPIATALLMTAIVLLGALSYRLLPVAALPNIHSPTIQVIAQLPGADPQTMASSVATIELGAYGITVNAVIPGLVDTPLTRHRQRYAQAIEDLDNKEAIDKLEAEARRRLSARSPFGVPWIEPEAIAPAVVFLASDEASMVSGATYDVTGGDSAYNAA